MNLAHTSELLDRLEDWCDHFKRKQHPVTLTLLRATVMAREQLAAAGGTEERGASSSPSCPGGDTLRVESIEILDYWRGASECRCASIDPIGACLKCDTEKLESRISMIAAELVEVRKLLEDESRDSVAIAENLIEAERERDAAIAALTSSNKSNKGGIKAINRNAVATS